MDIIYVLLYDDKDKADILQHQFTSVFPHETDCNLPDFESRTDRSINTIDITESTVRNKILHLDVNKSYGPDEISPKLLHELADEVSAPLTLVFNKSLKEGHVPSDWKVAHISPIFKKGSRNLASNYRPVSLTSIACKIMESFIKEKIVTHFEESDLFSKHQYGFVPGRSTVTQLLKYLSDCVRDIANGHVVDSIYFYFAKAFDTVPHKRLLKKLRAYGISGNIFDWIRSFISDRTQLVKVNGVTSDPASVISGIPQGSVLGPILFVIYINDLPQSVDSSSLLFADDTKIYKRVSSPADALIIQNDINNLEKWSKRWLLEFHPEKCHVLTLGKHHNIIHAHRYTLNGKNLEHVFEEKDLGVVIDSSLSFDEHISTKVKKANSIVGLIRRSFTFLDENLFKVLYAAFVRPNLEYAAAVWSPLKKHISMLEKVQGRATKLVDGLNNLSAEERLQRLQLPTLTYRRQRNDMVEIYKHFHNYDAINGI